MVGEQVLDTVGKGSGEFQNISQLIASNTDIQIAFTVMILGLIGIGLIYKKVTRWVLSKRLSYSRPHVSSFIRSVMLPFFALALITATNFYIDTTGLFGETSIETVENVLTPAATFAKVLDTFNILVIGYTISQLIPIALTKHEKAKLEREDYEVWFEKRGFADDEGDLFHKCFKWIPPKTPPEDLTEEEFQNHIQTKEGLKYLEEFRTSKGVSIGSYEQLVKNPFDVWRKSERLKYEKYFDDCVSGNNESGRKLRTGVTPSEIFTIDIWREEKRFQDFEPIVPGARPPGYAEKKREGLPKSAKQILPISIFVVALIGVIAWWGVDLLVLATAAGGLAIGVGFALQETFQNYFAYLFIRKDKIFQEGDRVYLDTGYSGLVFKITPRVTYIRHPLNESIAIIPTRNLVSGQIINYSKEIKLVPAIVDVGVSYLNNPKQVEAILVKIGKRAMKEVKDVRGKHLVVQKRCPYLDENKPSCGCDKDLQFELEQPVVRFNKFNDSSLDFAMWVYVRDYGAQFKTKSDIRNIMYEEFKKYDIRIPWPIRTIYYGDEKRESEEISRYNEERKKVIDEYGLGDLDSGEGH
jgi:small-conductance mechanosensitive channel